MLAINNVVPRHLPEEVRADMCQDLALAVLSGECELSGLGDFVRQRTAVARAAYGARWGHVSIDYARAGSGDNRLLKDRI